MMRTSAKVVAAAAVAALLLVGCTDQSAQTSGDGHTDHDHGTSHSGSGASPGPATEGSSAHNGEDVMFAQHMIPHHSQAVEMTGILLAKQDVDPRVRALAEQIRDAQGPEIEQMQGWLDEWGNPPMPAMDHGSMEGMVATGDIEKLRDAPGPEATTMFLDQMIGHHEGAITMARGVLDGGQFEPAKTMAQAIIDSQQHEIDEMKAILDSL
jgi:uncharacterized protein (DUF305 family)